MRDRLKAQAYLGEQNFSRRKQETRGKKEDEGEKTIIPTTIGSRLKTRLSSSLQNGLIRNSHRVLSRSFLKTKMSFGTRDDDDDNNNNNNNNSNNNRDQ